MNVEPMILVAIGVILVIGGLMRRPWNVIEKNKGNVLVAKKVGGSVNQSYQQGVPTPQRKSATPAPAQEKPTVGVREFIGWGIAVIGVVLTGIGVYLNSMRP